MRIGLVSPYSFSHPGGVQNHVLGLANWLDTNGHQVRIAGPGNHEAVTSMGSAVPVRFNGSVARICLDPWAVFRMRAWAKDLDLIHVHEPLVPFLGPVAMRLGLPTVVTCHADTGPGLHRFTRHLMRSWSADAVIAVSNVAAAAPRAAGIEPVIIGNGITVRTGAVEERPRRVTFLGRRDEPRKGFAVFLSAMAEVRREVPDVEAAVIGQGTPVPVGFLDLGPLDDDGRDAALAQTEVFVAPNLGGESFGIVLIEALAAGCDVVASDLPAFAELLGKGQDCVGRMVPQGDPRAMARAIIEALTVGPVTDLSDRIALAKRFDWDTIGPMISSIYEAVSPIA